MGCEGDILFLQPKTTGRLKRWLMVLSGGGALVNGWFLCRVSRRVLPRAGVPGTRDRDGEGQLFLLDSHCYLMFVAAIVGRFSLFSPPQACVYGVAAILWATAKFTLSPNQKLAVPRKLKRLLLEMAKRTAIERPSIVAAKKVPFPSCSLLKLLLCMLLPFSSYPKFQIIT